MPGVNRKKIMRRIPHSYKADGDTGSILTVCRFGGANIELGDLERCKFVKELFSIGVNGSISVPMQPEHCATALREHQGYTEETNGIFQSFAAAYTADEHPQERVIRELWRKLKAEH